MRRKLIAIILTITLSLSLSGCGDDTAKRVERLAVYTDSAIQLVGAYEQDGVLTAEQALSVRTTLIAVKDALAIFIAHAKAIGKIDTANKTELARLFAAVSAGVRDVVAVAKPLLESAIRALGIKDAEKLLARINRALILVETTSRLIESRLTP